jgi:hypothetical protein
MKKMAKAARRYDIYLPLLFNDGQSVPRAHFDAVEQRLVEKFRGVTSQQREFPFRGIWQAHSRIYRDLVIVLTALDFQPRGSTRFIVQLKRDLLRDFDQLEILITESGLRVH